MAWRTSNENSQRISRHPPSRSRRPQPLVSSAQGRRRGLQVDRTDRQAGEHSQAGGRLMERNVVSLDTAKKLAAAGFPRTSACRWVENKINGEWSVHIDGGINYVGFDAPTAQEIADKLIGNVKLYRSKRWFAVDAALKTEIASNVGEG